jgi:hypothetical protein
MTFEDLISKYVTKYGQAWADSGFAETRVGLIKTAIEEKNLEVLRPIIYEDNGYTRAIFERIAGLKLGKTQKARWQALREFVGEEVALAYDATFAQKKADHKAKADHYRLMDFLDELKRKQVNHYGRIMSEYDWMLWLIKEQGYTTLIVNTAGRTAIYELRNELTRTFYTFRRKIEYEALQYLLNTEK